MHARGLVGSAARRALRDLTEDGGEFAHHGRPSKWANSSLGQRLAGRGATIAPVRSNRAAMRLRVVEAIKAQPGASLRSVAAVAGVSPETVRLVRMSLSSVPDDESSPRAVERARGPATAEPPVWEGDAALVSCDEGDFVAWFDQTSISRAGHASLGPRRFPSDGCTRSPTRPVAGPTCG